MMYVQYPSGAPQVKAGVEEDAWDFGGAGVVPNIIGYVPYRSRSYDSLQQATHTLIHVTMNESFQNDTVKLF